jgi:hypothetical protein
MVDKIITPDALLIKYWTMFPIRDARTPDARTPMTSSQFVVRSESLGQESGVDPGTPESSSVIWRLAEVPCQLMSGSGLYLSPV